jgi:hypothetical protein
LLRDIVDPARGNTWQPRRARTVLRRVRRPPILAARGSGAVRDRRPSRAAGGGRHDEAGSPRGRARPRVVALARRDAGRAPGRADARDAPPPALRLGHLVDGLPRPRGRARFRNGDPSTSAGAARDRRAPPPPDHHELGLDGAQRGAEHLSPDPL